MTKVSTLRVIQIALIADLGLDTAFFFQHLKFIQRKEKKRNKSRYLTSLYLCTVTDNDSATPKGSSSPNFVGCCPAGNGTTLIYDQIIYILFFSIAHEDCCLARMTLLLVFILSDPKRILISIHKI
jgi:hypothetical protein